MNAQTANIEILDQTDIQLLSNEPAVDDFSNFAEMELLMNAEAANEDFMDMLNISEEDWDAATSDGFLIF